MMESSYIPIVDISGLAINRPTLEEVEKISKEIVDAFISTGFVYITNSGIDQQKINEINATARKFFDLPEEIKLKYIRQRDKQRGYSPLNYETLNDKNMVEMRESFDFQDDQMNFPVEVDDFEETLKNTLKTLKDITKKLLMVIENGLGIEKNFLLSKHEDLSSDKNRSCLRLNHYPPIHEDPDNIIRIGAHTDFGTITLLFQDSTGGLEIQSRKGEWIPAHPIEGTILVNAGDMLQRWTSNKIISTLHQVLAPSDESKRKQRRQSTVFFVNPDNDVIVEPIEKTGLYKPIRCIDYLKGRYNDIQNSF